MSSCELSEIAPELARAIDDAYQRCVAAGNTELRDEVALAFCKYAVEQDEFVLNRLLAALAEAGVPAPPMPETKIDDDFI